MPGLSDGVGSWGACGLATTTVAVSATRTIVGDEYITTSNDHGWLVITPNNKHTGAHADHTDSRRHTHTHTHSRLESRVHFDYEQLTYSYLI